MIEKTARNGHKIVELSSYESHDLGWGNICDKCNLKLTGTRFYVAVLNYGICQECLKRWESVAIFEEEDTWFENNALKVLKESGLPYVVENSPQMEAGGSLKNE